MDAIDRIPYDACRPLEFRVLTKLANVADQSGCRAFRTIAEVADELGVSHRSIQRALKALEDDRIIIKGDQRHIQHIRPDKRPTVYDINMPKCLQWNAYHQDELILLDPLTSGVTSGVTQLSTTQSGVTSGVTTAVVYKDELIELTRDSSKDNHRCAAGHELIDDRHCILGCVPELVGSPS
jgi:DNA-binding transcriptional ArsR family regulator